MEIAPRPRPPAGSGTARSGSCAAGPDVDHPPGRTLSTSRLRLRPHDLQDLEDCVALWTDPDVVRHIGGKPSTREEVWQRVQRYAGHWALQGFGFWTIRDAIAGTFIGEIGLADFKRDLTPTFGSTPECGWALLPSAQGNGFGAEALAAVLAWSDTNLASDRTVCLIDAENERSVRLALRCGFQQFATGEYKGSQPLLFERFKIEPKCDT